MVKTLDKRIELILASTPGGVIGSDGALPWRQREDMRRFRDITTGHMVVMGRVTFGSVGVLPHRENVVLSSDRGFSAPGATVLCSVEEVLEAFYTSSHAALFVAGGAKVYRAFERLADYVELTVVKATVKGDAAFPLDMSRWATCERQDLRADEYNQFDYSFISMARRSPCIFSDITYAEEL